MSYTTPEMLQEAWLGERLEIKAETVQTWIDRAERMLQREIHSLKSRLENDCDPELLATFQDVVCAMVERKLRNPEGFRSTMDSSGPFTQQTTLGGDNPGALWITPEERQLLLPAEGRGKAFSVSLYDETAGQKRWPSFVINAPGA